MTEHNTSDRADAPAGKPSQAEGSRNETEEATDINETSPPEGKPSQAEGDRETIEEELGER